MRTRLCSLAFAGVLLINASVLEAASNESQILTYIPQGIFGARTSLMIKPPACLSDEIAGHCKPEEYRHFLEVLRDWRRLRRIYVGYDGSRYDTEGLRWTQSSFIQPQTMVEDRYLYDPAAGRYSVDRYLRDVTSRYGGIDAILLWPVYPNIGIDDRNQLDMIRAMPGGIAGVKAMIEDFHRHGVRVLFPVMLWDQGTRDPGKPWPQAVAELMAEIGADGMNGDTEDGVALAFSQAADRLGHSLAFQPELSPSDEALAWNVMSWWSDDFSKFVPMVNRYKWLETRHMVNISDRWNRVKTDDLQTAFFNGIGWESWENVWGIWNAITPRDAEATRRMGTLERGLAAFLVSPDWEPFYPMRQFGVFASRWPRKDLTLWTIVNRNEYDIGGPQLSIPFHEGERYYDIYHGVELHGRRQGAELVLDFSIEGHGFGAVLATQGPAPAEFLALMARMKTLTADPLASFSSEWHALPQRMVTIAATKRSSAPPPNMIEIPAGDFVFSVQGIEIEGGDALGVDVAYPWEESARRFHEHQIHIQRFYIDTFPVSNSEFKRFLEATGYHPKDDLNFLKDWRNGRYPEGWGDKPVTWVSIEDARAYASWAGKRLPHEWEWQYAAQGTDHRIYPWGNELRPEAIPIPEKDRALRGPDDRSAHPLGASPFGVLDMVGNVWQWTDEYVDEHTRAAILRGGSYYQPQGSMWYFPQAYRNDQHGKYLLMAPSKDRSGTVGFRCVVDGSD